MGEQFTHVDPAGNARMVDVSGKDVTHRTAVAEGFITMSPQCFAMVKEGRAKKGDVLGVAQVRYYGPKQLRTSSLCATSSALTKARWEFTLLEERHAIRARCTVSCDGKTGVEMEALTAFPVALLTVYDMCKAVDKRMVLPEIRLLRSTGAKAATCALRRRDEGSICAHHQLYPLFHHRPVQPALHLLHAQRGGVRAP